MSIFFFRLKNLCALAFLVKVRLHANISVYKTLGHGSKNGG